LINCLIKQVVDIYFNKVDFQEPYILIIKYISVVTVACGWRKFWNSK